MNPECQAEPAAGVSFRLRWAIFIALALVALAIRLPQLGARPMHTDESINAYITGQLLAGEGFHYDPQDRHGPGLFALAEPVVKLLGAENFQSLTEAQLRLTPVLVGSATILLFGAGVELFGFIPCLVGALMFAFAPLPVYYNRYFIHETLFVAATFGLILSGIRAWQTQSAMAAVLAGFCAGLLLACKETCVIHFFALGLAVAAGARLAPREKFPGWNITGLALGTMAVVTVVLFTWFGRYWMVFGDLWDAVPRFAARAGGEGHAKAFTYYFHLLDPMVLLWIIAIGGAYTAVFDAVNGIRKWRLLLVVYGLVIFLIYSAIPYKTPWLALNLWLPMALICGFGVEAFWDLVKSRAGRWGLGVAGAFLLLILGVQTKYLAFDQPADEHNPLAYAHTGADLLGLAPRLQALTSEHHLPRPRIAVVAADAWPLPWYLRGFTNVGYWQPGQETGPADFYLTTTDVPANLTERLKGCQAEFFGVRPEVLILLWVPDKKP